MIAARWAGPRRGRSHLLRTRGASVPSSRGDHRLQQAPAVDLKRPLLSRLPPAGRRHIEQSPDGAPLLPCGVTGWSEALSSLVIRDGRSFRLAEREPPEISSTEGAVAEVWMSAVRRRVR